MIKKLTLGGLLVAALLVATSAMAITTSDSSGSSSNSFVAGTGTSFIAGQTQNQAGSALAVPGYATLAQVQTQTSYLGGAVNGSVGATAASGSATSATVIPGVVALSTGAGGAGVTTSAFHGGVVSSLSVQGQSGSVAPGAVATAQANTADIRLLLAPFAPASANINGMINFGTSAN